jgi:hypothetical protein
MRARVQLAKAINKRARQTVGRHNQVTANQGAISFWHGTFGGWESTDTSLMIVNHPSGEVFHGVPTYSHVKNDASVTWTVGTTIVRVMVVGYRCWVDGVPIGNPVNTPNIG